VVRLDDLVGKKVMLTLIDSEEPIYEVTLHGVETGGIWVENKQMQTLLQGEKKRPNGRRAQPSQKPVFFIPYAQIAFLVASSTELDEKSFQE